MKQKIKRYDKEVKEFIIQELRVGLKVTEISRKYDIPNQTVSEWKRESDFIVKTRRKTRYTEKEVCRLEQKNNIIRKDQRC